MSGNDFDETPNKQHVTDGAARHGRVSGRNGQKRDLNPPPLSALP